MAQRNQSRYCEACGHLISKLTEHFEVSELQCYYHAKCLRCIGCRGMLRGPFSLWNGRQPLCDRCLEERSPVCGDCGYPVSDIKLQTKFGVFHPDCFVCTTCKFPFFKFNQKEFFEVAGRPFCEEHALAIVHRSRSSRSQPSPTQSF